MSNLTPKEKAKELVDKYFAINDLDIGNQATFPFISFISLDYAKECALIAVEEIFNSMLLIMLDDEQYWHGVKTEIEKI